MKINKLYLLFLFISASVHAQDISGKWVGTLSQASSYDMMINVAQYGKVLNGTSRFSSNNGDFVEMRFAGTIDGSIVTLTENEVSLIPDKLMAALKTMIGRIRIDSAKKEMVIEGDWTSNRIYQNKQFAPAALTVGKFRIARTIQIHKQARDTSNRPLDGAYKKTNIVNSIPAPLTSLRESDVVYQRRIWREIDLREPKNQYMGSPKGRLIDALMNAITANELTAYDPTPTKDDPDGDAFGTPLTPEKAKLKMADSSVVNTFDKNGDKTGSKMVAGEFNPDSVVKFRIKEDVIFDKQRSVQEIRIIGIAPLIKQKAEAAGVNIVFDYQPAFWIYFPAARAILATKEVVNNHNDATGLSYDDVFTKRLFTAYIVKQSNPTDERIKDYAQGIDRLYESERIKKALMDWELSLWQY